MNFRPGAILLFVLINLDSELIQVGEFGMGDCIVLFVIFSKIIIMIRFFILSLVRLKVTKLQTFLHFGLTDSPLRAAGDKKFGNLCSCSNSNSSFIH